MQGVLTVLNEMERAGVVGRYAIGGAVGAIFYMEPILTYDLDVFVELSTTAGAGLLTLAPVYDYLRGRGYAEEQEYVLIEGIPVQFLPTYDPLIEEALKEADDTFYEQTPTRVLRAEYLIAIMLQTGRDKDRQRLGAFVAQASFDEAYLEAILDRHGLTDSWQQWRTSR